MGIPGFMKWLSSQSSKLGTSALTGKPIYFSSRIFLSSKKSHKHVDTLAIDMNGAFHGVAQKLFKYASGKPSDSDPGLPPHEFDKALQVLGEEILLDVEKVMKGCIPKKRLLLCVDGTAGLAKQRQQRQRRYRSEIDSRKNADKDNGLILFKSANLTPGTRYMRSLNKQILDGVMRRIKGKWRHLDVLFSDELTPGEGEHKIMNWIRSKPNMQQETVAIYGNDADLIMLSALLAPMTKEIFVLRDPDPYRIKKMDYPHNYDFFHVSLFRELIRTIFERQVDIHGLDSVVDDFVFLAFLMGNDFLPHNDSLDIYDKGVDDIISAYKRIDEHLPLVKNVDNKYIMNPRSMKALFEVMAEVETSALVNKYKTILITNAPNYRGMRHVYPYPILEASMEVDNQTLNFAKFRKAYNSEKLHNTCPVKLTQEYLRGLQWVLEYYTSGIPDWTWYYPLNHAPLFADIHEHCGSYNDRDWKFTLPVKPLYQLFFVLPPDTAMKLLPKSFAELVKLHPEYFPVDPHIDYDGASKDFTATIDLPNFDYSKLVPILRDAAKRLSNTERRLNELDMLSIMWRQGVKGVVRV